MEFKILEISTKSDKKRFVKSQWNFYKDQPNWVPPLIMDRMKLLDTQNNPFYLHSKLKLWVAESNGEIIGRIAGIINDNHNQIHNDKIGFFGFFECINNQEVANALYKKVEEWLKSNGMDQMRGPVNPSMNDECAFLSEGFDDPPRILMSYNPKYYLDLTEKAGFDIAKTLYAYNLKYEVFATEKLKRLQGAIRDRYKVTVRNVAFNDPKQFKQDIADIKAIYNSAWEPNWGFVKMTDKEFDYLVADFKQIANPHLAYIVEVNGKVAGFHLGLPDINQALIHNKKGGILGALWHLKVASKKKMTRIRIIVLGVLPEYQGKGIDAVIYYEAGERSKLVGMPEAEASWILEDNEMMNRGLTVTMNGDLYKKYRLYQKNI